MAVITNKSSRDVHILDPKCVRLATMYSQDRIHETDSPVLLAVFTTGKEPLSFTTHIVDGEPINANGRLIRRAEQHYFDIQIPDEDEGEYFIVNESYLNAAIHFRMDVSRFLVPDTPVRHSHTKEFCGYLRLKGYSR